MKDSNVAYAVVAFNYDSSQFQCEKTYKRSNNWSKNSASHPTSGASVKILTSHPEYQLLFNIL